MFVIKKIKESREENVMKLIKDEVLKWQACLTKHTFIKIYNRLIRWFNLVKLEINQA